MREVPRTEDFLNYGKPKTVSPKPFALSRCCAKRSAVSKGLHVHSVLRYGTSPAAQHLLSTNGLVSVEQYSALSFTIPEIPDLMPVHRARFRFIARFRPAAWAVLKLRRAVA